MKRKRYVKLVAGTKGLQVQEMRDAMRYAIERMQRTQEQSNRENHRQSLQLAQHTRPFARP